MFYSASNGFVPSLQNRVGLSPIHFGPVTMLRPAHWIVLRLVLMATIVAIVPRIACAHVALKTSVPANGARLTAAPRDLRLTFSEAPELAMTRVELVGPDGRVIPLDSFHSAPDSQQVVVARIAGPLTAGAYTVRWQIAGQDGHPVRGRVAFTIFAGAAGLGVMPTAAVESTGVAPTPKGTPTLAPTPNEPQAEPAAPEDAAAFDAESPLYVAVRWLTFVGILLAVGAVAFHYAVLGALQRGPNPRAGLLTSASARAARIGLWAAVTLIVAALLRLCAQTYAFFGVEGFLGLDGVGILLGTTVWGAGWSMQLVAALVLLVAMRRGRSLQPAWGLALVAAVALAFTPALSGHAASVPGISWLAILSDGLHVTGAAGWVGSLFVVLVAGMPAALTLPEDQQGPAVAALINAFSPIALAFAALASATGLFAAWLHVGSVNAIWQSQYGKTLLVKLAVLSVVAATGAYNWRRVKPRLGDAVGTERLKRSATLEVAVAVVVLLVTAVLVATPPATSNP